MPESRLRTVTANAIEQVRKDLMVAMGDLAYHVKADFLHVREDLRKQHNEIIALLARVDAIEERFTVLTSEKG